MQRQLLLALFALSAAPARAEPPLVQRLPKYVDALPIPPRLEVPTTRGKNALITVHLTAQATKLHRDLPEVSGWGYEGSSPGPTISVERGQALEVQWSSALPTTHVLARPEGAEAIEPDVRSVTHLHGAAVAEPDPTDRHLDSDGWPDNWIVPGETQHALYPNDQTARMLWYHDHAMASTGRNVAAGLIGAYEIHDDFERSLNLPAGEFEIPLLLQTKWLNDDGTLAYTDDIAKEFYGNAIAVNGKFWPVLTVEPRKYRFRVINASNARTYALKLLDADDATVPGPAFHQIGSDAGFLETPALLNDPADPRSPRLKLASAERADLIIDFSAFAGRTLRLSNTGRDISDDEMPLPDVLQIRVAAAVSAPDTSALPEHLQPIVRLKPEDAAQTRDIVFDQMDMAGGGSMMVLNGKMWMDPIVERPVLGTTEVWQLANTLMNEHPFHIHLVEFQVLDRRLFDVESYLKTGVITYMADAVPPAPNEMGWKDVVRAPPQMVTRIIMRFAPFPGYYVYHCHILEHEDMDMMRPFQVVEPSASR